jgi:hypothetical protein
MLGKAGRGIVPHTSAAFSCVHPRRVNHCIRLATARIPALEAGMAGFSSWVDTHFNLIQTVGIIGTLWVAIGVALREAKAKEVENLLTISDQHRQLWSQVPNCPELQRIFISKPDISKTPPTVAEEEFLNLAFVHYETGWKMARVGGITTLAEIRSDVQGFFALPLPRAVWEKTKKFRNKGFVKFVKRAMQS